MFHAAGDTGSTRGPESQNLVWDKMVNDFTDEEKEQPLFLFHLGDVIYSFGEAQYYYDQFYEPYRDYPAPILALAGNHDGMVAPRTSATSLAAFLENFCAETFEVTSEAGGLVRTAQIQPGVFFTFEAPLIRILALYSNTLEDPGVIASPTIGTSQLTYLETALNRVKSDKFDGALILAHHHPAYTAGGKHGWSQEMLSQIDDICSKTGVVMQDLREWLVRVSRKDRARRLSWQFQILSESWNEAFSAASRRGKFDCACCALRRRRGKVANDILGNVVLAGPRPGSPCLMPQRRSVLAPITTSI
ncbi:metallophosphoesterase family protein [Bradyrhizobium sp. DASA03076]|uniref:metallophosphoesterase family protein n=1 Tax=Bradyrhizobium sp. BLXBL-03 TaxID=3395916 RepID=UPI003F717A1E